MDKTQISENYVEDVYDSEVNCDLNDESHTISILSHNSRQSSFIE